MELALSGGEWHILNRRGIRDTGKLNSKAVKIVKELGLESESYKCNQVSFILD